jgi:hypothetical protein
VISRCFYPSPQPACLLLPLFRIDRHRDRTPCYGIVKSSVMIKNAIAKQSRQHCQGTRCEQFVDDGLLALEGFGGRTAGKRPLALRGIHDRRKQFSHGAKARPARAIDIVQGLAENELAVAGIVSEIQPIANLPPRAGFIVFRSTLSSGRGSTRLRKCRRCPSTCSQSESG